MAERRSGIIIESPFGDSRRVRVTYSHCLRHTCWSFGGYHLMCFIPSVRLSHNTYTSRAVWSPGLFYAAILSSRPQTHISASEPSNF